SPAKMASARSRSPTTKGSRESKQTFNSSDYECFGPRGTRRCKTKAAARQWCLQELRSTKGIRRRNVSDRGGSLRNRLHPDERVLLPRFLAAEGTPPDCRHESHKPGCFPSQPRQTQPRRMPRSSSPARPK